MTVSAQFRITGTVTDSSGVPIDAAVVFLVDSDTGTSVSQGITSSAGEYDMEASGHIYVYVSCLGYRDYRSAVFDVEEDTLIPEIRLYAEDFVIEDAVVTGERQTQSVRMEDGKMIYVPKNSSLTTGSTAFELLKKTPGVLVDGENNISVIGRDNVQIILNGKRTYMQKDELVSLMKSMPASSVSSVEVIFNPSAMYDAEGSGGIISINMDKAAPEGFAFSVNNGVSYWRNVRENTELSFSHADDRFSISGRYNHAFGHYDMEYGMHRIQNGKDYMSPTHDTDKRRTISGSMGMEYAIDKRQTVGLRVEINTLSGPGQTVTMTEIRDAGTYMLEQVLHAGNDYFKQKGNRYGGSIYYTASPKNGVTYAADFNYAWFDGGSGNWQPNRYESPDGNVIRDNLYKSENGRNIHICALSFDQQHPLWSGTLKSGARFSSVNAGNGYRFYNVVDGDETLDGAMSNDFTYSERIVAAYIQYSRPIGRKLEFEAGLRGEYTFSKGVLRPVSGTGENNTKDYFNLFPSFNLNYRINDRHTVSLSYARRMDRPAYQDLNPFEYMLDELSCWKGNPFLLPQKAHQVSASYAHGKTVLTTSYSYIKDYSARITDTISVSRVIMTPRNIGVQQTVSISVFQRIEIARIWEMSMNLTGYYRKNDIAFDPYRAFCLDGFAGIFSIQNTIRLPWKIVMELNGSYATGRLGAANEYLEPTGYADVGLSRNFLGKRLVVSLAMSDIFWTSRWDNYSSFNGFQLWNWGRGESRQIKLNITYRLGKAKQVSHKAALDEIGRL